MNKHNMVIFDKKWKKYNEIQLTKTKMDFQQSKNDKSSTLSRLHQREKREVCNSVCL